jgi:2,3-bisphosphoglycerate-independent phosphoglycerate mutase
MVPTTTVLIILDGWGMADPKQKGNAITPKTAPNFFTWWKQYPHTLLDASGAAVGLPKDQEGNSEAGHLNIGAGRVVKQDVLYISEAIKDGSFFKNNALLEAIAHIKKNKSAAHVMGLLSNHNSAHSCPEHVFALLDLLHAEGIKKVYLHLFTDGRDSGQHDAPHHLKKLQQHFHGTEKIATIMGRLYGMDRNKIWHRTRKAYEAMVEGKGKIAASAVEAITQAYNSGESDEFISPTVIAHKGKPVATIDNKDAIFFFNLRSDRTRQITKAFVQPKFENENGGTFKRKKVLKNAAFVAMTDFGPDLSNILTAFPSRDVQNSLVQVLCPRRQLYLAESEKFAHITYFFNGGYAQHFCDERWVKIASDRVKDFETDPAMEADKIAAYAVKAIEGKEYEFIAINFANADMVGHTGNLEAGEEAIRILDSALSRIIKAGLKAGASCIITADHGNAEEMRNLSTDEIDTEHSVRPVPFVVIAPPVVSRQWKLKTHNLKKGKLADVAPTILKIMGIKKPKEMTGRSLL